MTLHKLHIHANVRMLHQNIGLLKTGCSQSVSSSPLITFISGCHTFCTLCSPVEWCSQVWMLLYTQSKSVVNVLPAHTAVNGLLFTGIDCDTTRTT